MSLNFPASFQNMVRITIYGGWAGKLPADSKLFWDAIEPSSTNSKTTSWETTLHDSFHAVKRELAIEMANASPGDASFHVVFGGQGHPDRMTRMMSSRYASNTTVSKIVVQTNLFRMS